MKHTRKFSLALAGAFIFLFSAAPAAAQSELLKLEAVASYYGAEFHGKPTSSGEIFDMNDLTAAHKTLPFGTLLEVTNLESGKKITVRVNDRGPFVADRELDVSKAAAEALGMIVTGTARVSIRKLAGASILPAAAAQNAPVTPIPATAGSANASSVPATVQSAAPATIPAAASVPATVQSAAPATIPAAASAPAPVQSAASATAPAAAFAPATVSAAAPAITSSAASGASWRIQLGSFSKEDNATRLAVRLRGDGFNPAFEKSETLIRVVLTGIPEAELARMRIRLESAGYSGFLVRQESW